MSLITYPRSVFHYSFLSAVFAVSLFAQQTSSSGPRSSTDEEVIQLDVFQVSSTADTGYTSEQAMNATRTNEKLENLPNSISVMTKEFMNDFVVQDMFEAVEFAVNAENIYNSQGTVGAPIESRGGNQISFRGFPSVRQLRDGFPWYLPIDNFNTDRIEFSRGPGGLAYGDVDPGGIINIGTKRANTRQRYEVMGRVDSEGSHRVEVDLNQPLAGKRLALRLNAVTADQQTAVERRGNTINALALALRIQPFKHSRTQIDLAYEGGEKEIRLGHLSLTDHTSAYVRGTGTNAVDTDPLMAGVQANGVGRRRFPNGNVSTFLDIDGSLYWMNSTTGAGAVSFRHSGVFVNAGATNALDPQNPTLIPLQIVPESIVPRGQDWGGPDNRQDSRYHAFLAEIKHSVSEKFNLLLAVNQQSDDSTRTQTYSAAGLFAPTAIGVNSRSLMIDVNPFLPNPAGPGTIPNPNYEKYFVAYSPILNNERHDISSVRATAVYDLGFPKLDMTQRIVAGFNYRDEEYETDYYLYALDPAEMARRGLTGAGARFQNAKVYPVHYLEDGNSDEALALNVTPGVTTWYRASAANNQRFDNTLATTSVSALGKYFGERLITSLGLSRDYWRQNKNVTLGSDAATGELLFRELDGTVIVTDSEDPEVPLAPFARKWATNKTLGGVFKVLPWVSLSAGYFESSLFSDSNAADLTGEAARPRLGVGADYSVRFKLKDGRVTARATYFETTAENNLVAVPDLVLTELGVTSDGNRDYRSRKSKGYELEVNTNITRAWTLRGAISTTELRNTRFLPLVRAAVAALPPGTLLPETDDFIANQEETGDLVRRVNANIATRYQFTTGRLQGVTLGVVSRFVKGNELNAVSINGVEVIPAGKTKDYIITSPFIGYRRRFGDYSWNFQLNVSNVFNEVSAQGNSWQLPRYLDPRKYTFTTSVAF